MKRQSAASLWSQLTAWYTQRIPEFADTLNPGASEEEIRALEKEVRRVIGKELPRALSEVYKLNAGQKELTFAGAFFGLSLLGPRDVLKQWRGWYDIAEQDPELADEITGVSHPLGAVQMQYINSGHVPFAHDESGSYLGVDLSPGPNGKVGQVINFGSGEFDKFVLADSFEIFLRWILNQYHEGNYRISTIQLDEKGKMERSIEVSDPSSKHFLDVVPFLFGPNS